jgi:hypothetical protein
MLREQTIYISTRPTGRTETPVKPLARHKRRSTHITAETVKNKLLGTSLIVVGILSAKLTGDGTAMVMMFLMGLIAIFSK